MPTEPRAAGGRARTLCLLRAGAVWVVASALTLLVPALLRCAWGGSGWPEETAWWTVAAVVVLLAVVMATTNRAVQHVQRRRAGRDDEVVLRRPGQRWRSGRLQLVDGGLGFESFRGGVRLMAGGVEDLGPVLAVPDQPRPPTGGETPRFRLR